MKRMIRNTIWGMVAALAAMAVAPAALAEDGWEFTLGAGSIGANVYPGADEYYMTPFPLAGVSYTRGDLTYTVSILEGISVSYFSEENGIMASMNASGGDTRDADGYEAFFVPYKHSRKTRTLLADSPRVSTPGYASASLGTLSPVGILGGSVGYHPTLVEPGGDSDTDLYHGILYSAQYIIGAPISERLSVMGVLSLGFMSKAYADAWYGVEEATAELSRYSADGGLRDAQLVLQVDYRFTDHFGASLLSANTLLLGDAAQSPFTTQRFQPSAVLYSYFTF